MSFFRAHRGQPLASYSGEGRPEDFADLTRDVGSSNPDVTVALGDAVARAVRAANGSMPIVWMGGNAIDAGLATSLARPGGNITGVSVFAGYEIYGKRLQILKEAVPSVSKVAYLAIRTEWEGLEGELREALKRLEISLTNMPLREATPSEIRDDRGFRRHLGMGRQMSSPRTSRPARSSGLRADSSLLTRRWRKTDSNSRSR